MSQTVAFVVPYPVGKAPSQRFRVEQMLPVLDAQGIKYVIYPFMNLNTWKVLYKGGSLPKKIFGILKGFLGRIRFVIWDARKFEVIFIHREAAPVGPPVFEWILTKWYKKITVFDFDDAIWIPNTSKENRLAASVKAFWKIPKIISWVSVVAGGNEYLCNYASSQGAKKAMRIPTVVDTRRRYNQIHQHSNEGKTVVGWTGSHSTLKYLDEIMPVLKELQEECPFIFMLIADKKPELDLKDWTFVPWNADTEIEDLMKMDIGIMPLTPDPWSEGKCGFKLIQYLSLGIPALASPVGVNAAIIDEDQSGYLCSTDEDWKAGLRKLIKDAALRQRMGEAGRKKIVEEYSIDAISGRFLSLMGA